MSKAPWAALLVLQFAIVNVRSQPEEPSFIADFPIGWVELVKEIDLTPIWDMIGPIPEGTPLSVDGPCDVVLLALRYSPGPNQDLISEKDWWMPPARPWTR